MKILHVGPVVHEYADGPSRSIVGLAQGQANLGHTIGLLTSDPSKITQNLIPKDIKLLLGPKIRHLNPFKLSPQWINKIKKEFGMPDLVHFHDFYIPFQMALARQVNKEGWPYMSSPRGSLQGLAQRKKFLKKYIANFLFAKNFLNKASLIHALNKSEAIEMEKFVDKSKIIISPNGIDGSLISLEKKIKKTNLENFIQLDDLILVYIGRIDIFTKGLDLLLHAFKKLENEKIGKNIKLIMIGPFYTNKDKRQMDSLIGLLKYPENIKLTGPIYSQKKWQILKASDILVLTSRHEGMPNVIPEAMAFKKPFLVTPGTGMNIILAKCDAGWLADESADSISKTIIEIAYNKRKIKEKGVNGQIYVRNNMTWELIAAQLVEKLATKLYNN